MKKSILFLTIASLFLSCSNSDSSGGSNSAGNVDYFFNININGVEHKVQGNTSGFGTVSYGSYMLNPNSCQAQISTTSVLQFKIADITKPNFVSGQNLFITIYIPNCHIGQNQAMVNINTSPVYDSFRSNLPLFNGSVNWMYFQQNSGIYNSNNTTSNYITVNITDMGTSPNATSPYGYGNTFKGNFTGTVYFPSTSSMVGAQTNYNHNIPMQLDISFSAYRIN
jgi:hypothetical protein